MLFFSYKDVTSLGIHCFHGLQSFVISQDLSTGVSYCCLWEDSDFLWKICSSKQNNFSRCFTIVTLFVVVRTGVIILTICIYRYGIRIDPIQWIIVLNGGTAEFGIENPSVYLFICKYFH